MMTINDDVSKLLPLVVEQVIHNDPFATLVGPGWTLALNSRWTIHDKGMLIADSDIDPDRAEIELNRLRNKQLTACAINEGLYNPAFEFGPTRVQVVADTELDPWVMHVEGLEIVLVGYGPLGYQEWLTKKDRD